MSEEQEKQPKPTSKFAPMKRQWETIGGGKESTMPQDTLTQERKDTKAPLRNDDMPEMKRQTVYMPKALATRLKVHAASRNEDISGIITQLVEQYLEREEGK